MPKKSLLSRLVATAMLLLLSLCPLNAFATELEEEDDPAVEPSVVPAVAEQTESLPTLVQIAEQQQPQSEPIEVLGEEVQPGQRRQLAWTVTLNSIKFNIPVIVAHGKFKGPVVGITAALHGDELNGIEIARQVLNEIDLEQLSGTLIAVPIVNLEGFLKQSRYIADRRDLNRYFPGNPQGVMPARYADGLFQQIILKCDRLIDLHTGSYYRTNLPQLRADLGNDAVAEMVEKFGSLTVLHSSGVDGMLRNAATAAGVPAVTMEVGGPLALNLGEVSFGVRAINQFLGALKMIEPPDLRTKEQPIFYQSSWLMAEFDGILLSEVNLGERVVQGQQLARIVNPIANTENPIIAPYAGTVLGMAENQFVSPGYLIFRIGIEKTEQEVREEAKEEVAEQSAADGSD